MKIRNSIMGIVVAFFIFNTLTAQALVKYPPERLTLPNGVKLIAIEDNNLPLVTVGMFFNVKPYHEACKNNGLARIYRELLVSSDLKGETRFDFNEKLEELGITKDFSENPDVIYLGCTGANLEVDEVLKAIKKMAFELEPSQQQFNNAKSKVKGFLKAQKRYPRATNLLEQKTWQRLFGAQAVEYNCPIDESLVTDLDYQSLAEFKNKIIQPNNTVLVVIANKNTNSIFNSVAKELGQIKNLQAPMADDTKPSLEVCNTNISSEVTEYADIRDTEVVIGFEAPAFSHPQMPASYLWQTLINDSPNSPIKKLLQRDYPDTYNFFARYIPTKDYGLFLIGYTQSSEYVDQSAYSIISKLKSLSQAPYKEESLKDLIEMARIKNLEKFESRLDRAIYLGLAEVMGGYKIIEGLDSQLNYIDEATFAQAQNDLFNDSKYAISIIKPNKYKEQKNNEIAFKTLENGANILTNNYPASDLAGLTILIGTDFSKHIPEAPALAAMLATYINDEIEGLADSKLVGARIKATPLSDCLIIEGKIRNNRLNDMAIYLKELLLNSELYTKESFKRIQDSTINSLDQTKSSPYELILTKIRKNLVDTNTYSLSKESILNIKYKDVKKLYTSWEPAKGMNIVAVGSFDTKQKLAELESIFKEVPYIKDATSANLPAKQSLLQSSQKEYIKLNNSGDRSIIAIAFKMPPIINASEIKAFAANSVLAHALYSSDNSILKEELAKVDPYVNIQGEIATNRTSSIMSIYVTVPTEKEKEAVEIIEKTVAKIPSMSISMSQINATQKRVLSDFVRLLEKPNDRATMVAYMLWSGMNKSIANNLLQIYSELTPQDVNAALTKYYNHYYLLIGN
jgi:predicted Zn-dependent peptidase